MSLHWSEKASLLKLHLSRDFGEVRERAMWGVGTSVLAEGTVSTKALSQELARLSPSSCSHSSKRDR